MCKLRVVHTTLNLDLQPEHLHFEAKAISSIFTNVTDFVKSPLKWNDTTFLHFLLGGHFRPHLEKLVFPV
jgi:hypothetical protein